VVRLLHNPALRERMGKAGREKMEREFDERLVIEKTLKVYQHGRL
jgi:glycosyltransferase involved in cell wall biosynthesis